MKILIIGAGPVGLTCAHLLSKLSIPCTILEKQLKLTHHPSAHFLHSRTLEIFDSINTCRQLTNEEDLYIVLIFKEKFTGLMTTFLPFLAKKTLNCHLFFLRITHSINL